MFLSVVIRANIGLFISMLALITTERIFFWDTWHWYFGSKSKVKMLILQVLKTYSNADAKIAQEWNLKQYFFFSRKAKGDRL